MELGNLSAVERKVLGALLILANNSMDTIVTQTALATTMGYKKPGGAITFALRALEMKNYISTKNKGEYRVLI